MLKSGSKSLNESRKIWTCSFVAYSITSTRRLSSSRRLNLCSTIFLGYDIAFAYNSRPDGHSSKYWMCSARPLPNVTRVSFFSNLPDKTSTDCTPSYLSSIVFWLHMPRRREKRNDIFWNYTQKDFYSYVSNISITNWEMPVINIIFWLIYTMKISIIYINEKLLLYVGCRCHKEGKRGMIYFKSLNMHLFTHTYVYIYTFHKTMCSMVINYHYTLIN